MSASAMSAVSERAGVLMPDLEQALAFALTLDLADPLVGGGLALAGGAGLRYW